MENYSLLIYISCIIFLIIIGKVFIMPLKKIMKLVINSAIGAGLIYIINLVGANFNFHIGLNWFTIICSGILGIPGVILIILLR
mgnify:FL=1